MSRSIVLGNGEMCVALDEFARVRDIYYPHVGLEDHVRGHYLHRVGVFVDGQVSWLGEDAQWRIAVSSSDAALESAVSAVHDTLGIELSLTDFVYNEQPVFMRRITITNRSDRTRGIKIFLAHQFEIGKSHGGETAYYDPAQHAIVHYKGNRAFVIGAVLDGVLFDDYTTGLYGFGGKEGSHLDAGDGTLTKNPIEHGQVDSVLGLGEGYTPGQSRLVHYWIAAGKSIAEATAVNAYVVNKTPEHLVHSTHDYWHAWVSKYDWHFHGLSDEQVSLFKRSLFYMRAHVDGQGGILASLDSDMLRYALDTYGYVWPRDAAYGALALDRAGDVNVAKRFFEFSRDIISPEGYFMQKYLPDGSIGSSWHPWIRNGIPQLPIQVDETALVVYALCEHYSHSRDLEFVESMYVPLVEKAADFLVAYRDPETKLPRPSYDLWEEKRGCATFTAASVYGALAAAAALSKMLGKIAHSERYGAAAEEVRLAILSHLWNEAEGVFFKSILDDGSIDRTVDISSVYGVFSFGVLPASDQRLAHAFETSVRRLSVGIATGGIARYEGDYYQRDVKEAAGNPWIITTLWYAEYLIATARSETDLARVKTIFDWVVKHALPSGVLPEQSHAQTGAPLSATPLMWSHAAYVSTVLAYLDRLGGLGLCVDCNPVP